MKWFFRLACTVLLLSSCAAQQKVDSSTAGAQVGIVNHTGSFIYSATVDGAGGGTMSAWGAGIANICCASIPRAWYPGMKVLVSWDMPIGHTHVVKEKVVEVEKYDRPGDIYLHFFADDEVRVVITNYPGYSSAHPIPATVEPATPSSAK